MLAVAASLRPILKSPSTNNPETRKDTIMALQREWIDRTNQFRQALLKLRDSL